MQRMFYALASLSAGLLALPASAQEPQGAPGTAVCDVASAQVPTVDWRGVAAYHSRSTVKEGRVVQLEITALTGGVDRSVQRSLVMAIQQVLRVAKCQPGDHVFEKDFSFDLRQPLPAAVPDSSSSPSQGS